MDPLIDFAIATAIEIERRAVCQIFQITDDDRVFEGSRVYWRKSVALKDGEFYEVVVVQSPDMGGVDSALLISDTIHHWNPGAILLVGIAAGVDRAKQQLGDLIIGRDICYYERGKLTPEGKQPEPIMYRADSTLWSRVQAISAWRPPPTLPRPDGTSAEPKIHYSAIASGEKVIADPTIRDEITSGHRKIAAIEMEGYGFSAAAWQSFDHIRSLVIKAVCDFADTEKSDDWHLYAATVAASFAYHFLQDRPLEPRNAPHRSPPAPSQYKPIINQLKFGNIVPFLGPGINPNLYVQLAAQLGQSIEDNLVHDPSWQPSAKPNIIQRLIGMPCQACYYLPDERPKECPMLLGIERAQHCPLFIEQQLAVAKMNLRYLSQYYKLTNSLNTFYAQFYDIFETTQGSPNSVHRFFAELPFLMKHKGYPNRYPGLPYQLIVTTNYDNLLEQAFDKIYQPYDVIYYIADGDNRGKYKHRSYQSEVDEIIDDPKNYDDQLPLRKPWGRSREPRPIILKLYGTWENNFVVADDHLIYLASSPIQNLPPSLFRILYESSALFLGYSPNDSDLQLIVHRLWQDKPLPGGSRLIHHCQPGEIEQKIWQEQRNTELIATTCSPEEFVASLRQDIEDLAPRIAEFTR
ncbi:MAG: SIR2 family protein [Thainema sp.]